MRRPEYKAALRPNLSPEKEMRYFSVLKFFSPRWLSSVSAAYSAASSVVGSDPGIFGSKHFFILLTNEVYRDF